MATGQSPNKKMKLPDGGDRWTRGGPEDHLIMTALDERRITTETPPAACIKLFSNELSSFSNQVVRTHLTRLKQHWANQNNKSFASRELFFEVKFFLYYISI